MLFDGVFNISGYLGFPGVSDSKEFACNAEDLGLIPSLGKSPGGGHGKPFQYSCLENPHEQRSLVGYSSWGCRELNTTERLSTVLWIIYKVLFPTTGCTDKEYNRCGHMI